MKVNVVRRIACLTIFAALLVPSTAAAQLTRHHLGIQLGLFNPSTDAIELGNLGIVLDDSHGQTVVRYRYSVDPRFDLVAELRYWVGRGPTAAADDARVTGGYIGPGLRIHLRNRLEGHRVMPYVQGNVYYVSEVIDPPVDLQAHGVGYGVSAGVHLALTRRLSVPLEASYVANGGGGIDDLSGVGVSTGISVSF